MTPIESFSVPDQESRKRADDEISDFLENTKKEDGPAETDSLETKSDSIISSRKFYELHGTSALDDVYHWYATAMQRRDREPLERNNFIDHFFNGGSVDKTYIYGDFEKGFLLGYEKHGVFIPSHFAPKTLRGGYEMLKELGDDEKIPVVMAITNDLAETIKKMPSWQIEELPLVAEFRGRIIKKKIAHNNKGEFEVLKSKLLREYMDNVEQ